MAGGQQGSRACAVAVGWSCKGTGGYRSRRGWAEPPRLVRREADGGEGEAERSALSPQDAAQASSSRRRRRRRCSSAATRSSKALYASSPAAADPPALPNHCRRASPQPFPVAAGPEGRFPSLPASELPTRVPSSPACTSRTMSPCSGPSLPLAHGCPRQSHPGGWEGRSEGGREAQGKRRETTEGSGEPPRPTTREHRNHRREAAGERRQG